MKQKKIDNIRASVQQTNKESHTEQNECKKTGPYTNNRNEGAKVRDTQKYRRIGKMERQSIEEE